MLSLSPRRDLFRFNFPKDFIPEPISKKYNALINKNPGVFKSAVDYLNESIQSVTIPGVSDVNIGQIQHSSNSIQRRAGKINVEPKTEITYQSPKNPLDFIDKKLQITFRMNQGCYNYFMLFETLFYQICKPLDKGPEPVLYLEILNEDGVICSRCIFRDCYLDGMDDLELSFNKIERDSFTFNVSIKFNNIDFEFADEFDI